jgi:tRNA threonylcarbamoyladenosine biosynthesis protein TsaE
VTSTRGRTAQQLDKPALVAWGREVGEAARPPLVLALFGELGAGKSVFARAVARGAGVQGPIPSPTFNLLHRYTPADGGAIVHLDLYRLETPAELGELGWDELPADDEIVLVEWPERAGPWLPEPRWELRLAPVPGRSELRDVRVARVGDPPELPLPSAAGAGARARAADGVPRPPRDR